MNMLAKDRRRILRSEREGVGSDAGPERHESSDKNREQTSTTRLVAWILSSVYAAFRWAGLRPGREFEAASEVRHVLHMSTC